MSIYQLKTEQVIPASIEQVWEFISSPRNLSKITPPYMGFEITNEPIANKMYAGMIISYIVSPILGLKMNWVTEISYVKGMEYFVDVQRVGPYAMWHHQHHIREIENGVEMTDIVSYKSPLGFLGTIANNVFIKKQLKEIFNYRFKAVEENFGKWKG
jgi:ligand-binding SRPBCC domain-containing protein